VVADGTDNSSHRLQRVLTSDPGMGILRHADAGYSRAIEFAKTNKIEIPVPPTSRD
jgi:urocanate hydratase